METVQNGTNLLSNLLGVVGQDGVKMDFKVELDNSTYIKLGATFLVVFVLALMMWLMFKTVTSK
ncbi:hypothetical protein [Hugenholtzia roseola]|uniref:hypothetical protein n=1 Tax=Hugenholtzia roseola TaxID=1002 RepID=UPI0004199668|nr:hypothetical protein [Hugenholtzia roseola]